MGKEFNFLIYKTADEDIAVNTLSNQKKVVVTKYATTTQHGAIKGNRGGNHEQIR